MSDPKKGDPGASSDPETGVTRSQRAWILAVTCAWCVAAGAALLDTSRRGELSRVVEAKPTAVADLRARAEPSAPSRLAPVQASSAEQRVVAPARLPEPPRESVTAKLQRLRPLMLQPDSEPNVQLHLELQRMEQLIHLVTREELQFRSAHRIGIVTPDAGQMPEHASSGHDPYEIYSVQWEGGACAERIVLPRTEFAELYQLRVECESLRALFENPSPYCSVESP